MERDIIRLHQLLQEGYCCSQVMVKLGLEMMEAENPQLVQAVSALCLGVRSGLTCGALSGAALLLCMFVPDLALKELIPELFSWFSEVYGEAYGGTDCDHLLGQDLRNKALRCPALVENTYRKTRELLEEAGVDFI